MDQPPAVLGCGFRRRFRVLARSVYTPLEGPLLRQIRTGADGTRPEAMSAATRDLRPKHDSAELTSSICPYCGVGCGQLVYHKDGKLISIEGDPSSPISRGRLCSKGADTFELHTHPERLTKVKYRRPYGKSWETRDGRVLMQTTAIAHLGGATLDNEENYLESGGKHVNDPLRHGPSGTVTRLGGALSGPLPASPRLLSLLSRSKRRARLRRWAALSAVAGSFLTRVGWIQAGHASARDWRRPLEIPDQTRSRLTS